MAQFVKNFVQDLTQDLRIRHCGSLIFNSDSDSNIINVALYNGEDPAPQSGSVVCSVICSDGSTVPVTGGTISGNVVSVTLGADGLIEGQVGVGIQVVTGSVKTTVLKAIYNVELFETDNVVDPSSRITLSVSALISAIDDAIASIPADYSDLLAAIAPVYTDLTFPVKKGRFCWQNGVLYAAKQDINTSESWTASHWVSSPLANELSWRIDSVKSAVKPLTDAYNSADWQSGSLKAADGTAIISTTRIRTKAGIASGTAEVIAGDGYEVCVYGWSGSTYLGIWTGSQFEILSTNAGAFGPSFDISAAWQTADTIRLLAGKVGGATIAAADGVNIFHQAGTSLSEINRSATAANNRIDHLMRDINQQALWENGSLSNGANTSNDTRLRTITYLQNGVQKIMASNGYDFVVCCYNPSTNAYAGIVKGDGTVGTANFYWHTSVDVGGLDYKMRLILRNPDDTESDMPLSAYANISLLSAVDAGLATSGAGADAKVTGERLAALDAETQYGHYSVRRNNPEYVSAMMTIAQSYMAANSDTILRNNKHFEYGNNSILQVSTSTNLIDCSTFVGLVMRGYALSETSYMADVSLRSPSAWVAKSGVAWAIDPFDFKVVSKPGEDPSRLRWAAQLAEWMIERSQVVPMTSGLAEVMPGDILFWARKDAGTGNWVEPLRYRHISHVGFCLSRTKTPSDDADVDAAVYPYKHMTIEVGRETYDTDGVTVLEGCVKSKLLEAEPADPADWETTNNIHTLVLVCRPDLGSI